jgi:D-3-phosphoglycerate dehydrogenase
MEHVFIVDPIHPAGVARIGASHALISDRTQATVLVIRTSPLSEALIAESPALKLIVKHGAGVDNIPIPACTARGIIVANTPGGNNSTAVAEGAVTLMLAVLRRVRAMDALVREDRWDERWSVRLGDLTGAKLGLIGFGRIARQVAKICGAGFGAEVAAYDPMVSASEMAALRVIPLDLPDIMARDVISIHTPLTPQTRNLIGAAELAMMHTQAVIVNSSRGGIIDEAALFAALQSGAIGGAGIDVFDAEPPPADHPLFTLPNVVLSPHVAGVTEASMKAMALAVADVIDSMAANQPLATLLNPEALAP